MSRIQDSDSDESDSNESDSDESDLDESAWIRSNIFVSWTQNTLLLGLRAGVIV